MKKIIYLIIALLTAILLILTTSCSKKEDVKPITPKLDTILVVSNLSSNKVIWSSDPSSMYNEPYDIIIEIDSYTYVLSNHQGIDVTPQSPIYVRFNKLPSNWGTSPSNPTRREFIGKTETIFMNKELNKYQIKLFVGNNNYQYAFDGQITTKP
jgi:hypothetical protein